MYFIGTTTTSGIHIVVQIAISTNQEIKSVKISVKWQVLTAPKVVQYKPKV